jgi:hypothetical protein
MFAVKPVQESWFELMKNGNVGETLPIFDTIDVAGELRACPPDFRRGRTTRIPPRHQEHRGHVGAAELPWYLGGVGPCELRLMGTKVTGDLATRQAEPEGQQLPALSPASMHRGARAEPRSCLKQDGHPYSCRRRGCRRQSRWAWDFFFACAAQVNLAVGQAMPATTVTLRIPAWSGGSGDVGHGGIGGEGRRPELGKASTIPSIKGLQARLLQCRG